MSMWRKFASFALGCAFTVSAPFVNAVQTATNITPRQAETIRSTANPGRIAEDLTIPPHEENLFPPNLEFQSTPEQRLPAEMAKLKFKLNGLKIIDHSVFSCEELLKPFQEYMGTMITLGKLEEIANQITVFYKQAGYVLTQVIIPPQRIKDGTVTLRVISGYVDKVEVSGDIKPGLKDLIESYGRDIQDSRPLHAGVLERALLLANDIPGITVQSVLTPSKHKLGASDLVLVVKENLDSGFLAVNSFGTRYQGPLQYVVGGEEDSKFRIADSTQYQYVTTGNKELNSGQIRHSELLNHSGLRLNLYGQVLKSHPASLLAPLNVLGDYKVGGAELFLPFIRSRQQDLSFRLSFVVLKNKSTVLQQLFYDDRIRPVAASILYSRWDFLRGLNSAEFTYTIGLKIFRASQNTFISRPNGKSDFTRLNLAFSRIQTLPYHFSLFALATGQYAFQPLLSAMQFGFGGSGIGRGYDPSEIVGDKGVAGCLELRYKPLAECPSKILSNIQLYTFYDVGKIWNIYKNSLLRHASAASTGLGVRLGFAKYLEANFYVAKPLTRVVAAYNNRHPRIFFSVLANIL